MPQSMLDLSPKSFLPTEPPMFCDAGGFFCVCIAERWGAWGLNPPSRDFGVWRRKLFKCLYFLFIFIIFLVTHMLALI